MHIVFLLNMMDLLIQIYFTSQNKYYSKVEEHYRKLCLTSTNEQIKDKNGKM